MSAIPVVTRNILIINVLVWLAQSLLGEFGREITIYGALFPVASGYFLPHQIITYMFLHGGLSHLFFNMFAVFMFGRTLETVWGPKRFLIYYMLTGIGAGLTQLLVCHLTGSIYPTVGASGAVFGILVAFGMLFPNSELFIIPFPFPIKAKWFVIGYGLIELGLGISNNVADNVAHFAHLGGLVTGLIIILFWRKKGQSNGNFYR
ncbi:MAG: rhomboid family intramembrane serine protease [Dysgonomonas sp.]|nr:rhomboid family intramembrane serine protease [Dysgonomonas sp.]